MKVYDYLINFLFQNRELFLKVRSIEIEKLNENQKEIVEIVKYIFKKIFRVLEVMSEKNSRTQELMWKYKEAFVFENLGESDQEGELELVLAIIDDSEDAIKYQQNKWTLSKTRQFVNSLNKRIKGSENFVLILEIFNKLIKFEAVSFLKPSLIKMIMNNPADIHAYDKETRRDLEKSQNLQEIIFSIICNQEMIFTRDFLTKQFPLHEFFDQIDRSISQLDKVEQVDKSYDAQDYEELRHFQYIDLVKVYGQLYFHPQYSNVIKDDLEDLILQLASAYIKKLGVLADKFGKIGPSIRKSEIRFLMVYLVDFFHKMELYYKYVAEEERINKTETTLNPLVLQRNPSFTKYDQIKKKKADFEKLREEIYKHLEDSDQNFDEILEDINETGAFDVATSSLMISRKAKDSLTATLESSINPNGRKTVNSRSQISYIFTTIWDNYVKSIVTSRNSRILIDKEHNQLANLMFDSLTKKGENSLLVQSYKTFITTSIDYVFTCEKARWTLYIIIFIFKINTLILKR